MQRWYLDGTVECFSDTAHIVMGTLAILLLVGLILLVPLVVLLVVFEWHPIMQVSLHAGHAHQSTTIRTQLRMTLQITTFTSHTKTGIHVVLLIATE